MRYTTAWVYLLGNLCAPSPDPDNNSRKLVPASWYAFFLHFVKNSFNPHYSIPAVGPQH